MQHHGMPTKIMEAEYTMVNTTIIAVEEDAVQNAEEIGAVDEAVGATMIWLTTVGLMECVLIQEKNAGTRQKATRRTRCGATRFWGESGTAPDRSG